MAGVFRLRPLCCVFCGFAWRYGITHWTVGAERVASAAHSAPQEKTVIRICASPSLPARFFIAAFLR